MADEFYSHEHLCLVWKVSNMRKRVFHGPRKNFRNGFLALEFDPVTNSSTITLKVNVQFRDSFMPSHRQYSVKTFLIDRHGAHKQEEVVELNIPDGGTQQIWTIAKREFNTLRKTLEETAMTFVCSINSKDICPEHKLTDSTKVSDQFSETSCSMDTVACLKILSHDFEHLMADRTQSDVTLNCEERPFPAHKNILSARSPVFSAMFQSDMEENRTGIIEIIDMDASILHQFLLYVYSGKLSDLSVDTVPKLYAAADKYAVESLTKLCSKFMKENLARENVCKFLITADVYGDKAVKDCAINFITNIDLFLDEHIWFAFHDEHPKLASEVLYHGYKTKCLSKQK